MLILAFATGFIKPWYVAPTCYSSASLTELAYSIAPIIADQCPIKTQQVKTLKSGERVIVDPKVTVETMLHVCTVFCFRRSRMLILPKAVLLGCQHWRVLLHRDYLLREAYRVLARIVR